MKINICFVFSLLSFVSLTSCNTTEPPPDGDRLTLELKLEDVSCTEAWIKLTSAYIQLPAAITLKQTSQTGETKIKILNLNTQDSLLYIDSLLPNQTYKILAAMQQPVPMGYNNASNELSITTMDTTSHNFTWQAFTFGEHSSSVLYDVAIINENNIWAVGEIYMNDSLGNPDPICYNAVHWNGQGWELKRIQTLFRGNLITVPLEGIFAFSSTDIWMAGSLPIHGNGTNWIMYDVRTTVDPNLSLSKVWGISSNDIYFVGKSGNIAHYQNGNWQKIESGTEINLRDVWGTVDGNEIFISGYSNDLSRSILLYSRNNTVETIWENKTISGTPPYGNLIYSIAGYINNLFISSNQGVFKHRLAINYPVQTLFIIPRRVYNLASSNINDVFTAGDRSSVWHYNGISKKELYINLSVPSPFYSVKVKGNVIVAAGSTVENAVYHQATLIIGNRI